MNYANILSNYEICTSNKDTVKITDDDDHDVYSWTISDSPYNKITITRNNTLLDNENFYYSSNKYYSLLGGTYVEILPGDIDLVLVERFNYSLEEGDSVDIQTEENSISLKYPNSLSLTLSIDSVTFNCIKLYTVYDSMETQKYIYEIDKQPFSTDEALALYLRDTNNLTTTKESTFVLYRTDGSIYKTITTTNTLINDDGGSTSKKIKQVSVSHYYWVIQEENSMDTRSYNFLEYHIPNQKYYYNKNYEGNRQVMELTDLLDVITKLYNVTVRDGERIYVRYNNDGDGYSIIKRYDVVLDTGITILYYDDNGNEHKTTKYSYDSTNKTFKNETFTNTLKNEASLSTYTADELMKLLSTSIMYVYENENENIIATFEVLNTIVYYDVNGGKHTTTKYKYNKTKVTFGDKESDITYTDSELMALLCAATMHVYEHENIVATFVFGKWRMTDLKYYTDNSNAVETTCLIRNSDVKLNWISDITCDVNTIAKIDFNEIFKVKRYYRKPVEVDGVAYDEFLWSHSYYISGYGSETSFGWFTNRTDDYFIYEDDMSYFKTQEEMAYYHIKSRGYIVANGDQISDLSLVSDWVICNLYNDINLSNKIDLGIPDDLAKGCIFNTGYNTDEPSACIFHYRTENVIFTSSSNGFTFDELNENGYVVADLEGNILFIPSKLNGDG